jgi:outer membrane protein assembly factor BamB
VIVRLKLVSILVGLSLVACGDSGGDTGAEPGTPGTDETKPPHGVPEVLDLRIQWEWPAPPPGSAGMPAADASGIVLTTARQRLVMLDAAGKVRWQADHDSLRDVAPLLTADTVVAATEEGVVAYDRANGRVRWETRLGERANTPVAAAGRVAVSTWEGSLVALDLSDGRLAWRTKLGGPSLGPAASGGAAVVATFDSGRMAGALAVDATSGRQRWSVPLPAGGVSAPAVAAGDTVVVVAGDVAVHGLSLEDGSTRWRNEPRVPDHPRSRPFPCPTARWWRRTARAASSPSGLATGSPSGWLRPLGRPRCAVALLGQVLSAGSPCPWTTAACSWLTHPGSRTSERRPTGW